LRVLEQEGIEVSFIAGSSAGALVGGLYAMHKSVDKLIDLLSNNKWDVLNALIDPSFTGGLVKGEKLASLLSGWFGEDSFEDLQIPLTVLTADLRTAEEIIFNQGKLIPAVRASMTVPGVFKPVEYEGRLLVDGGLVNPVPDEIVRAMGADVVLAVNLDNHKIYVNGDENYDSVTAASIRSINILRHYLAKYSTTTADIVLEPNIAMHSIIGLGSYLLPKYDLEKVIMAGEVVAINVVDEIKALMQ